MPFEGTAGIGCQAEMGPWLSLTCTRVLPIEAIKIGHRHRKDLGDITSLARSIEEIGLLHFPVVTPDNLLVAGARRIDAVKALGWSEITVHVVDLDNIVRGESAENMQHKSFTPSETVAIARALEPIEKAAARDRMVEGGKVGKVSTPSAAGKTRDKLGAYVGISGRTIQKATVVVEAAERDPERFGKLVEDMDRTGRVDGVHLRLKRLLQAEKIRSEPPPLPSKGPYRVLVVDPPWQYHLRQGDPSHPICPYPTMSHDAICSLPVGSIAADDAVLWLWTTNAHLRDAFAVLDAWGFEQKSILTWVKDRMGTGDWLRGQTEHCLMAVRGKPVVTLTNQTTVLHGPVRAHSQKPEQFFAMVEALCPAPRYAELFSRQQRPNWDGHGDECGAGIPVVSSPASAIHNETGIPGFLERNPDNTLKHPGELTGPNASVTRR